MYLDKFSKRLKELMELEGLSKRALSLRLHVDRKSIRLWLNGVYFPRYDALIKLSLYFKVWINYLVGIDDHIGNRFKDSGIELNAVPAYFCETLKKYMQEKRLTKYAVAKKIRTDQKTLTKWLTQGSMPETATVIKIAQWMNVSLDELLGREN